MTTHCANCGGFCPSGTLDNGLCNECDLIGKTIPVLWSPYGIERCLVDRVSRHGTVYARRWKKRRKAWSAPYPVDFYKGWRLR